VRYLKLSVAVLAGLSLAVVCGLVVNTVSGNEMASNVAAAAAAGLALYSIRADI